MAQNTAALIGIYNQIIELSDEFHASAGTQGHDIAIQSRHVITGLCIDLFNGNRDAGYILRPERSLAVVAVLDRMARHF